MGVTLSLCTTILYLDLRIVNILPNLPSLFLRSQTLTHTHIFVELFKNTCHVNITLYILIYLQRIADFCITIILFSRKLTITFRKLTIIPFNHLVFRSGSDFPKYTFYKSLKTKIQAGFTHYIWLCHFHLFV